MTQTIIVFLIIAAAVTYTVLRIVKRYRHRNDKCCDCGCGKGSSCTGCPMAGNCH